jgi:hypothetical protein
MRTLGEVAAAPAGRTSTATDHGTSTVRFRTTPPGCSSAWHERGTATAVRRAAKRKPMGGRVMEAVSATREAIGSLDPSWVVAIGGWLIGLAGWSAVAIQRRKLGRLRTENRTSWPHAFVTYHRAYFLPFAETIRVAYQRFIDRRLGVPSSRSSRTSKSPSPERGPTSPRLVESTWVSFSSAADGGWTTRGTRRLSCRRPTCRRSFTFGGALRDRARAALR